MATRWSKVRLLEESVPFYDTESGDAAPVAVLHGTPVVEITSARFDGARMPTILGDGRRGFIASTVEVLGMVLWSTASRNTVIYSEPRVGSAVVATLPDGSLVEQHGLTLEQGGSKWVPVMLTDGRLGYMPSQTQVVTHGKPVREEESPGGKSTLYTMKDAKLYTKKQWNLTPMAAAKRNMLVGGLWCIGGIVVTIATYAVASGSGGMYFILWGPAIFGGIRFVRGVVQYFQAS